MTGVIATPADIQMVIARALAFSRVFDMSVLYARPEGAFSQKSKMSGLNIIGPNSRR
jgi:hypothetical protein